MIDHVVPLKRAIPYIRLYKGKTFVVKIGGNVVRSDEVLDNIAEDVTLLHQLGVRVVIVHGGGPQATELSQRLGIPQTIVDGRRVTSAETLDVAKMVYAGKLNIELLSALRRHGTLGVGLSGIDGGLARAVRRPAPAGGGTDFGFVGDIVEVNTRFLDFLLAGDYVPVICSLASDADGVILNVNADSIASHLARAAGAEKLVLLTDTAGLLRDKDDPSSLVSYTDIREVEELFAKGAIKGGMMPKVEACVGALRGGVRRTHILDGTRKNALLTEVFTNEGCGTMIVSEKEKAAYLREEMAPAQPATS